VLRLGLKVTDWVGIIISRTAGRWDAMHDVICIAWQAVCLAVIQCLLPSPDCFIAHRSSFVRSDYVMINVMMGVIEACSLTMR